jgi:hypothetical protein
MRWRVRAGYLVAVAYWLLASPTPRWIVYGATIAVVGLLIRGAASGHLRKDRELAVTGPYAWTRNPLYLGSAFLAAGFIIAGHSWASGVLVGVYFAAFYYAVMRNEERDLRARFGSAFDEYAARVPLFFPWFPSDRSQAVGDTTKSAAVTESEKTATSGARFSWALYLRNREYQASIGGIVGFGTLFVRMWIRARWGY